MMNHIKLTETQRRVIGRLKEEFQKPKQPNQFVALFENYEFPIFEVSKFRSEVLKEIDQNFAQIKVDKKNLAAKKELMSNIKKFSGIDHIILSFKKDYMNAAVIPIYNRILSLDIINVFKDYEAGENIRTLDAVEEPSKYISKIYIVFGNELIDLFSSKELTAILLHELGHVFTHTANLPRILLALFTKGIGLAGFMLKTPILYLLHLLTVSAYIISSLIIITVVRTLNFLDHKGEYHADQFAAKYGYGDEMIKVLYKIHNVEVEKAANESWFEKVWEFIEDIFVPSSHPKSSKRIKEINEQMLSSYKKMYPKLSTELNIILKDIKK